MKFFYEWSILSCPSRITIKKVPRMKLCDSPVISLQSFGTSPTIKRSYWDKSRLATRVYVVQGALYRGWKVNDLWRSPKVSVPNLVQMQSTWISRAFSWIHRAKFPSSPTKKPTHPTVAMNLIVLSWRSGVIEWYGCFSAVSSLVLFCVFKERKERT